MTPAADAAGFLTRYRRWLVAAVVVVVGLIVFTAVWFQPQKLFIDETVSEEAPAMARTSREKAQTSETRTISDGEFRSLEHAASGRAVVLQTGDRTTLRLADFRVENGPDLFVYLSAGDADGPPRALGEDFVDLGRLKGNVGDQNYDVPPGTDLDKYRTVVIWCRRFTVAFAAAELA